VVQRGTPGGFDVLAPGLGRARPLGGDADIGQEALLLGVKRAVGSALVIQPRSELLAGAGESVFGNQRVSRSEVSLSAVVNPLPPQVPRGVPPRVEFREGGGALGGKFGACGALVGQPQAEGEAVDLRGVGRAQVAVLGGVGAGVAQAARKPPGGLGRIQGRW
jgi:hypothetical protein